MYLLSMSCRAIGDVCWKCAQPYFCDSYCW